MTTEEIERGRTWALLSWASLFVGLPLFLVPMITRDNAFALAHAKHTLATLLMSVIAFVVVFAAFFLTCGFGAVLFPLLLLPYVTVVHGFVKAVNGDPTEPMLLFGLSARAMAGLTVRSEIGPQPRAA